MKRYSLLAAALVLCALQHVEPMQGTVLTTTYMAVNYLDFSHALVVLLIFSAKYDIAFV
jgi:hypothetical protein